MKKGAQIIYKGIVTTFTLSSLAIVTLLSCSFKQTKNEPIKLPDVSIQNIDGKTVHTGKLNSDKTVIICFWSVSDPSSIRMLNAIQDTYYNNGWESNVKIMAISTDNNNWAVKSKALFSGWDFEVYTDSNNDFKSAMGVGNSPCVFVIDNGGKSVYNSTNCLEENDDKLFDVISNSISNNIGNTFLAKTE